MQKRSALFKISILIGATFWLWLTALNAEANSSSKKIWNTLEDIPQSAKTASDSIPKTSKAPVDRVPVSPEASDEIDKQMKAVLMR